MELSKSVQASQLSVSLTWCAEVDDEGDTEVVVGSMCLGAGADDGRRGKRRGRRYQ